VFVITNGSHVVGFVLLGGNGPDILEIRPSERGKGYGRRLAEWSIAECIKRGCDTVDVQCAPFSSRDFWMKFGFMQRGHHPEYLERRVEPWE
jgi:GNAT superfamily N-acetyltransferase